ncbi:50S ribosomal protein L28 [Desulfovirgula thermocuniculi]|uniref:50S ribosomal protein L28 n=1 Tax=Desulfovirgula thermocuniculi TaxID=348842 RepID=UPI00040D7173|nr:50S ribosomal protein L28 [Desulfovirgula thermocuniculi]
MAKRCAICGKGVVVGMQVSHSNRRTKRTWTPNLQRVRAVINGTRKRIRVCTSCLRKVQRAI